MPTSLLSPQAGAPARPCTGRRFSRCLPVLLTACFLSAGAALAQTTAPAQPNDEEYTAKIREYLNDPRVTTELVDHLPASSTVPTPLKFFGKMPGQPGELYYSEEINKYYEKLAQVSPRAKFWKLPLKSEEGRDMIVLALADEDTIRNLDKYKTDLAALGDPRKTTEAQAQQIIHTSKPIYWITSGIHSPETGGPQMLVELAYRLIVEETPFINEIRNHAIVMITPVIETDGRDKEVDTYYYNKENFRKTGVRNALPLMYWGKYVQHDNNRDGMGQLLNLTKNMTDEVLEWHPTILHDLHEAQSYLYVSTGTGPYNPQLDPITSDEWWLLGETEIMEMTKRGVPGVWTYGFYDGWVPNYLFWIAETHNAFGRFYEVQNYGPDVQEHLQLPATTTSREWYRPNPPLPDIKWGPRNNTNIQESAILFALNKVAKDHELYLENYWLKSKRTVDKGKNGPVFGWVIPAGQEHRVNTAEMVNDLRRQGVEVQTASGGATVGDVTVAAGDYIIRADQPYRTLVDLYFSRQNYPVSNPLPYDDTGWTMPLQRNVIVKAVSDKSLQSQPMTLLTKDVALPGIIQGSGDVLVVQNNSDNVLATFRFRNKDVKMEAAEEDFTIDGQPVHAGAFIVRDGKNSKVRASIQELGLVAWATSAPKVKTHPLTIPRIGYVHSWSRTQDEGWVRAALDHYGIPFTYFADQKLKEGNLRAKYDVIIFPHVGGTPASIVNGIPMTGSAPIPYKKTAQTPNLGAEDSTDDIRGGMGIEGLNALVKFVEAGGTLITEGSTSTILPEYGVLQRVTVEHPTTLYARGAELRGVITDHKSPIVYGYTSDQLPVYFNQDPVLTTRAAGGGPGGGGGGFGARPTVPGVGQNTTPNSTPIHLAPYPDDGNLPEASGEGAAGPQGRGRGGRGGAGAAGGRAGGGGGPGEGGAEATGAEPRVVMSFPTQADNILLSGELAGGQALTGRALAIDQPLGKGHVVMFALRPYWRWQTQGTFALGFNTIVNWDHLDAGAAPARSAGAAAESGN